MPYTFKRENAVMPAGWSTFRSKLRERLRGSGLPEAVLKGLTRFEIFDEGTAVACRLGIASSLHRGLAERHLVSEIRALILEQLPDTPVDFFFDVTGLQEAFDLDSADGDTDRGPGGDRGALNDELTPTPWPDQVASPQAIPCIAESRTNGTQPSSSPRADKTFENFIPSAGSEVAFESAQAVAHSSHVSWNPLFLHGPSGIGKTHLLRAIQHQISQEVPTTKVVRISFEEFLTGFQRALRQRTMPQFRQQYREACEVLLIDDLQSMATMPGTQEELFHTLCYHLDRSARVVITSDAAPAHIKGLAERLRTRFEGGMVVEMGRPDFEARKKILQQKSSALGMLLPSELTDLVASQIRTSVRALEGILFKLFELNRLKGRFLIREEWFSMLGLSESVGIQAVSPQEIMEAAARAGGITVADLVSTSRSRDIVKCRNQSMIRMREELKLSLQEIGRLHNRDHTSVAHALRNAQS